MMVSIHHCYVTAWNCFCTEGNIIVQTIVPSVMECQPNRSVCFSQVAYIGRAVIEPDSLFCFIHVAKLALHETIHFDNDICISCIV